MSAVARVTCPAATVAGRGVCRIGIEGGLRCGRGRDLHTYQRQRFAGEKFHDGVDRAAAYTTGFALPEGKQMRGDVVLPQAGIPLRRFGKTPRTVIGLGQQLRRGNRAFRTRPQCLDGVVQPIVEQGELPTA